MSWWTKLWAEPPTYRRAYAISLETILLMEREFTKLLTNYRELHKQALLIGDIAVHYRRENQQLRLELARLMAGTTMGREKN